jgi:dTMP kinase
VPSAATNWGNNSVSEQRGRLITVEGVEGAGKTTAIRAIGDHLAAYDRSVSFTREPGGTPLGESLRGLLLDQEGGSAITPETELLLMFASRAQHVAEVIEPALRRGQWVVCDRFTDASYAYQGGGRGIEEAWIADLEARTVGSLVPDLTLLLDVTVEQGRERAAQRGAADRFEREADAFFERVRAAYAKRQREAPERIRPIDATREPGAVAGDIGAYLDELVARDG